MNEQNSIDHIGFILDGHRRWAKSHGLREYEGHNAGYENLKKIIEACFDRGIGVVSAYIFSTENWKRTKEEVNYLMKLLERVLTRDIDELNKKNIRLRFAGSEHNLSQKMIKIMRSAEEKTKNNDGGTFCACFNYGGREEIVAATRQLINDGVDASEVTEQSLKDRMYTHDLPEPDMIIRSSGEQRLSNFLLWDSAYAELYFTQTLWPDFDEKALDQAIDEYYARERRFGK